MKYNILGKTGLKVSEIGLGAQWLRNKPFEIVKATFDVCLENGVNIFDCWMPEPEIRSFIGECIKNNRDKWIIQGHIGSTWQKEQYVKTRELGPVKEGFEDLRRRLGTDCIELGIIHYVDTLEDWNEIINGPFVEYVKDLKKTGKIKHIGLSTHNPVVGKEVVKSGLVEMLMFAVNPAFDMIPPKSSYAELRDETYEQPMFGTDPDREEFYRLCEKENIAIVVMKPFAGGRLFDSKLSPFGKSLTSVQCLHYALTRPATVSVVAGYSNAEDALQSIAYETASDDEKNFAKALADTNHYGDNHQCMYCNHCKPCPKDIDIASVNKYYDLAVMHDEVPDTVRSHYFELKTNASDCTGCGGCETRCPFKVPVVEIMKKARTLFAERIKEGARNDFL